MSHYSLVPIVELLLIACLVAIGAQRIRLPYTIALVLVGLAVAVTKLVPDVVLSPDIIFSLILPPLLFEGAMRMDLAGLKENWKPIVVLAIPGVVMTMLVAGVVIHYVWKMDWGYAFLFGALIAPTDPISVLAILKNVGAPRRLRVILEGESLFNDGTGIVLFSIILGMAGGPLHPHPARALFEFIKVISGSVLIGAGLGFLVCQWMRSINDHLLEVTITVVLVFGTSIAAEYFQCSGVIAVVVAGLIMGHYGKAHSMSIKTRETIETFWEVMDFMFNSLVFLLIGIELQVVTKAELIELWRPVLSGIFIILLTRAVVVYAGIFMHNLMDREKIPWAWCHVFFWGGLRGAIPLALAVGLPQSPERPLFLTAAFGIVLFSLVVQGMTIQPLLYKLKIFEPSGNPGAED